MKNQHKLLFFCIGSFLSFFSLFYEYKFIGANKINLQKSEDKDELKLENKNH
jgi:phosphotransferase system  glucose/maltose/N-acetylglucosamine-specific IIC component